MYRTNDQSQPNSMIWTANDSRSQDVRAMFAQIASKYDLMNRLMTFGQDGRWRKWVVRLADLPPGGSLLDVGSGTGELARYATLISKDSISVSVDFTPEMIRVGKKLPGGESLLWSEADALSLPFCDNTFDSVVSGFFLRNVSDVKAALTEQLRVLKPGGRMVALDTTRLTRSAVYPLAKAYMHYIVPLLGHLITGHKGAYKYLPVSTDRFLKAEVLVALMAAVGFVEICFQRMMFGTVAIHWGRKRWH